MGFSLRNKRLWIAGHRGLVGSALLRYLSRHDCEILIADHSALDLRDQDATRRWVMDHRPDGIILAAALVGGIEANRTRPAEFIYDNLMMAANVINAAASSGAGKLLFLGSSCIYPRLAPQPIAEEALLTGPLEPTNEAYAVAKIAGIALCQSFRRQFGCDFIAAMPCNLYGPGDRFDPVGSHVIPAMMMKFHAAKRNCDPAVNLWGTGNPLREFLHVDDLAVALATMLETYSAESPVNIGSGAETSIRDLALLMAEVTGYTGAIAFDASMPDGTPRKVLNSAKMRALGWSPAIGLRAGLESTYHWYCNSAGAACAG